MCDIQEWGIFLRLPGPYKGQAFSYCTVLPYIGCRAALRHDTRAISPPWRAFPYLVFGRLTDAFKLFFSEILRTVIGFLDQPRENRWQQVVPVNIAMLMLSADGGGGVRLKNDDTRRMFRLTTEVCLALFTRRRMLLTPDCDPQSIPVFKLQPPCLIIENRSDVLRGHCWSQ